MKKTPSCVAFLLALFGAATSAPALASGSYAGRPPQPPAKSAEGMAMKMDREKFALGQKIYGGAVMTAGGGDPAAQLPRLKAAQMKLPADAMKMKDLTTLAGKLSAAQLDALEYFVAQRFGMKK